jgi:hypothetical protein
MRGNSVSVARKASRPCRICASPSAPLPCMTNAHPCNTVPKAIQNANPYGVAAIVRPLQRIFSQTSGNVQAMFKQP